MSFIVTVNVNEGIVMASDSRISISDFETINDGSDGKPIVIKETMAHYADTAYKTFLMDGKIGISTCGNATINNAPIAGHIETFIRDNAGRSIKDVPQLLKEYFSLLEPKRNTTFFVAGYDTKDTGIKPYIYRINTAGSEEGIEESDTTTPVALWDGERDVASRLFTDLYIKRIDNDGKEKYTKHKFHPLASKHWTLQDAIEFAQFATSATASCMKFQQRAKTVGGPVDILVIKPDNAFWIQRKELHP